MRNFILNLLVVLASFLLACSGAGDDWSGDGNENNVNVNIGGVQDIGLFRRIIEAGDIPGPSTLDPNGFFSEHYLEYPFGNCIEDLCLNGMVGRGINLVSKNHMNALQVVIKGSSDAAEQTRPPTDFIAVIDVSASMGGDEKLQSVKEGLHLMVDSLNPDDGLSLISYSGSASTVLPLTYASSAEEKNAMHEAISSLMPMGGTNIYSGLEAGFSLAEELAAETERHSRLLFLSDGLPTEGVTDEESIIGMAQERSGPKIQVTSIGVGYDVNFELMKSLSMSGGNFYFVENNDALLEIFLEELDYFAYPLAEKVEITLNSSGSFYAGDSVGFDQWRTTEEGGAASIPAVYAASRTSSSTEDPSTRRGGGSALFIRLVPKDNNRDLSGMVLKMTYKNPKTQTQVFQEIRVDELAGTDGVVPVDSYYSEGVMQKSFLMLNLYLALKEVCQRAANEQYGDAAILLRESIKHAREVNTVLEDEDISADILLMEKLLSNLGESGNGYCSEEGDCYYDDTYYENETVDYGCNSAGSSENAISLLFAFLLGLFLVHRSRG